MFFFLAISFALFSLSTACLFGETSFLIPPLNMPLLYFEGGGGGLDLKAEEVSLPSWGLLYYFFSPVKIVFSEFTLFGTLNWSKNNSFLKSLMLPCL